MNIIKAKDYQDMRRIKGLDIISSPIIMSRSAC